MIGVLHCLLLGIIIAQPATPLSRQDFITLRNTGHSPRKTGALKTLTVLVKHPKAEPHHTREEMERVIYQDLNAYVKSSSYGQAHLEGKAIGWYSIPDLNLSGFNLFNKKIDPKGVHEFIKQVLDHAQDHEDVSKYDHLILVMGTRGRPYGFNGMAGPFEDLPFLLRNGKVIRHGALGCDVAAPDWYGYSASRHLVVYQDASGLVTTAASSHYRSGGEDHARGAFTTGRRRRRNTRG